MQPSHEPLPESLTRHLSAPRDAIWPTPGDRHRPETGRSRPRTPTPVFAGLWLWAAVFNVGGGTILYALWCSMGR